MKYLNSQKGIAPIVAVLILAIILILLVVKTNNLSFLGFGNQKITEYIRVLSDGYTKLQIKPLTYLTVPNLSGKVAFIKDGNVWWAQNGKAFAITADATQSISPTFDYRLSYFSPVWSPNGKKLAFLQEFGYSDKVRVMFSDGKYINKLTDSSGTSVRYSPPFWLNDDTFLEFSKTDTGGVVTGNQIKNFQTYSSNPYIYFDNLSLRDGCGGGGRQAWETTLSGNHLGSMEKIRATFFYISGKKEIVYSTGCENQTVEKAIEGKNSNPFDARSVYDKAAAPGKQTVPQELMLSHNGKFIVGTKGRNVVIYDLEGNLIKQLSDSNHAYGAVLSPDDKTIYYGDNLDAKPILMKLTLEGDTKELYRSDIMGAISNISVSADNKLVIFTQIEQDKPNDSAQGYLPDSVKQSLYIIDNDGTNLQLFLKDAYQGTWSPK